MIGATRGRGAIDDKQIEVIWDPAKDLLLLVSYELQNILKNGNLKLKEHEAHRLLNIADCAMRRFSPEGLGINAERN